MPNRRSSAPALARPVALLALFAFGCATVRVPASTIPESVPVRGGVAEPQIELWVESGEEVSPAESAAASAEAKAALESALAGVSAPQGDALLVVRAQGVTRTPSRRANQKAAVAGLVVGAVVVVAAVVVLIATQGKGGGGGAPKLVRAAPRPRPVPVPRPVPIPARVAPRGPAIHVDVLAGIQVPAPEPYAAGWVSTEPQQGWDAPAPPPAPAWTPPAELTSISLPPPPPLDVDQRGFFAGDTLRLELVVVDRHYGTPLWTKVVDAKVDPRDGEAVERVLGDAMADGRGWVPASP